MKDRTHFIVAIHDAIGEHPNSKEEQSACIEALLLTAATVANAMSEQCHGYSKAHVTEAAETMRDTLDETFGVDI